MTGERTKDNPWAALLVICLGFFMIMLDTTIVYIATPSLLTELHATLDGVLWVINGYLLAYAVLLVTAGRLGDAFGLRRLFAAGLVVFMLGSALSGLAPNIETLVAARVIQGIGGALLAPQSLALLTAIFPRQRMGAALGIWSAVVGLAAVAGPTVGGAIVTIFDWRWIFLINLPIGALALAGTMAVVPDVRPNRKHDLDFVGMTLSAAGLAAIVFALVEGERYRWGEIAGALSIPSLLAGGAVLMAAFFWWQGRRLEPLVPGELFADRNYALMNATGAAVSFASQAVYIPLVIFLQSILGLSALDAGFTVAPIALASLIVAPIAGRLTDRIGGKPLLLAGLVFFATGTYLAVHAASLAVTADAFRAPFLVIGVGLGLTFAPMTTLAMRDVPQRMVGAASGLFNTTRQLGSAIGAAAIGAVLQAQLGNALVVEATNRASGLTAGVREAFVDGFARAAERGLEVGIGQTGGAQLPSGLPADLAVTIAALAHETFGAGYIAALQATVVLPLAVLAAGAAATFFTVRRRMAATEVAGAVLDKAS